MMQDTDPIAAAYQIRLLRDASTARRVARMRSLSASTISLSRRAIRRTMPDADEQQVLMTFVAMHYGDDVAKRLAAFLDGQR